MDLPAKVQVTSELLGGKGQTKATLVAVSPHGFYELKCELNQNIHRVLVPIQHASIIFLEPEVDYAAEMGVER